MRAQPTDFILPMKNPFTPAAVAEMAAAGTIPAGSGILQYEQSHWNDDYARKLGFKKANLGGFIKDDLLAAVSAAWGPPFLNRGSWYFRHRRPLFDGDLVRVVFGPVQEDDQRTMSEFTFLNQNDERCVVGSVALPHVVPEAPPLSRFPRSAGPASPLSVAAGKALAGAQLPTEDWSLPTDTAARLRAGVLEATSNSMLERELAQFQAAVREPWPELLDSAAVPPWNVGGQGLDGVKYENILAIIEFTEEYFRAITIDDVLETRYWISDVTERKGSIYLKRENVIVANGDSVVARRTQNWLVYRPIADISA